MIKNKRIKSVLDSAKEIIRKRDVEIEKLQKDLDSARQSHEVVFRMPDVSEVAKPARRPRKAQAIDPKATGVKAVIQSAKAIIKDRDSEIKLLRRELTVAKGEKRVTFTLPTSTEVTNFPNLIKVHVENQKEFPKEQAVRVLNLKDIKFPEQKEVVFPKTQDVHVLNLKDLEIPKPHKDVNVLNLKDIEFPEQKEVTFPEVQKVHITNQEKTEKTSEWLPSIIALSVSKLGDMWIKMWKSGITVRLDDDERLKPLPVIMVDTKGRPINPQPSQIMIPLGGGRSGGSDNVSILDKYQIADGDEVTTTKYYGFTEKDGGWYILKNDTTANSYRYSKGSSGYSTAWSGRASLTYDYFDVIF